MACANHPSFEIVTRSAADFVSPPDRSAFRQFEGLLRTWLERGRQRRALGQLDDRLLRDIGATRTEAAREAAKPFWVFEAKND
jgi:uncharacterized protein YjiS (DUF1127 family)